MKHIVFAILIMAACSAFAQVKITDSGATFKVKLNSQPALYYAKNNYEIFFSAQGSYANTDTTTALTTKIGIRNVNTGVVVAPPVVFSYIRVNDTAYSTLDSVILKLRYSIFK